jgi:hypothetical protein
MEQEKKAFKGKLDDELKDRHFLMKEEVMRRTHPSTLRQRLNVIWNKEIEVSLLPLSAVLVLLFLAVGLRGFLYEKEPEQGNRELIEISGNVYWKDQLEKAVMKHEG